jgi:hypothetical protein
LAGSWLAIFVVVVIADATVAAVGIVARSGAVEGSVGP